MNNHHDPLARLRAARAAEHAAMVLQSGQQQQRYAIARAFGYRVAVERLTWAEIRKQRSLVRYARFAPEFAHASPCEPLTVGKGDMTMQVLSSYEWAAYLDGVDAAGDAVEAQG